MSGYIGGALLIGLGTVQLSLAVPITQSPADPNGHGGAVVLSLLMGVFWILIGVGTLAATGMGLIE